MSTDAQYLTRARFEELERRLAAVTAHRDGLIETWTEFLEATEELSILERANDTTKRFDRALDRKYAAIDAARAVIAKVQS